MPRRMTPLSRNLKLSTESGGDEVLAVRSMEVDWRYERSGDRGKAVMEEDTQKKRARWCIMIFYRGAVILC